MDNIGEKMNDYYIINDHPVPDMRSVGELVERLEGNKLRVRNLNTQLVSVFDEDELEKF
jgi:hypothetical protein